MKLIKQGEQEGRRCAVVGLYTDRMAMSVMQRGEQGSFCLYRRQWEGELLDQQGELDVERLAGVADSFRRLAQKLCCEEVHFCGYGLLRYRQGLREELEQKLGCPVQVVSGLQQARVANLGLFDGQSVGRGAAGIYSGDLSTQFFGAVGWRQSVPLGWRVLWKQGEGLIPNRVQEEQLRSDLDEYLIESLKAQDAKINSWGVGTRLITANDNPAFGGVYKLAAVKDADSTEFTPKIKLSENTEKVTNPGNKTVYRLYNKKTGKIRADLICLADEKLDADQNMVLFDPIDTWKKTKVLGGTYEVRELLVPVIKEGKRVYESPSVMELRDYCQKEQNTLWDESRRFVNPQKVYVDLSQKLWDLKKDLLEEISEKALD